MGCFSFKDLLLGRDQPDIPEPAIFVIPTGVEEST
jgi:hypothetical protein